MVEQFIQPAQGADIGVVHRPIGRVLGQELAQPEKAAQHYGGTTAQPGSCAWAEVWAIAIVLVGGGAVLGYQSAYWSLAENQSNQVKGIREAYDTAMTERDKRLEELTRKTGTAADKATKAATTAAQAVDKADEALNRGLLDR